MNLDNGAMASHTDQTVRKELGEDVICSWVKEEIEEDTSHVKKETNGCTKDFKRGHTNETANKLARYLEADHEQDIKRNEFKEEIWLDGDLQDYAEVKEEIIDDDLTDVDNMPVKSADEIDGFVNCGPAVIVELVGGVTMDMVDSYSLENAQIEMDELDECTIQTRQTRSQRVRRTDALDDITKATPCRAKPPKRKKKVISARTKDETNAEFVCFLCTYKSASKKLYGRHMRNHTQNKRFQCTYCEYKTLHAAAMKVHIRTHTGEKPYVCDECGYRTTQKCHLNTHLLIHTDEKPMKCKFCNYRCRTVGHMRSHMRIHLREDS